MEIKDESGGDVSYSLGDTIEKYTLTDERFIEIAVQPVNYDNVISFGLTIGEKTWYFTKNNPEDPGLYYFWTEYG